MSSTLHIKYCDALIPHVEYITFVGSALKKYTKAQAISLIDSGVILFTTDAKNDVALVEVFKLDGKKHIRTAPDSTKGNNLLWLPACPSSLPPADGALPLAL
jgi:hypothetical protein